MNTASIIVSIFGLSLDVIGAWMLISRIFITNEEIRMLSELPIEETSSHLTSAETRERLAIAGTDVSRINEYRERHIQSRLEARRQGRRGLGLIIAGFLLQGVGQILKAF